MQSLSRATRVLACIALVQITATSLSSKARAEQSLYAPATCCDIQRSGDYGCPAPWAIPTDPRRYSGYYVGGGAVPYCCCSWPWRSCATEHCRHQGTWGWDYVGYYVKPFVRLDWWHPPRCQGGPGNYAPDGPHFCEDLRQQ